VRVLALSALVLGLVGAPAAAALAVPAALPAIGPLPGDASNFSFRSFHADYQLGRSTDRHASLRVVETLVALFPQGDQNHGIVRDIPATYGSADLQTNVVSVTNAEGRSVNFSQDNTGGFVQLQIGDAGTFVHGATTYVITYTQVDTIRHFANTNDDEFYWDVNGTGWAQPFGTVSATVHLSPGIAGAYNNHSSCYQGAENSTTPCSGGIHGTALTTPDSATPDPSSTPTGADTALAFGTFTASATNLAAGENLTIAIGFTSGTFVDESSNGGAANAPGTLTGAQVAGILLSLLGFPAVLVGAIGGLLARRQRAEPSRGIIIPQYSPPTDLDVMSAAELINRRATAVPAELVSLAVRGRTRLLGYPVSSPRAADYSVQLLDPTGLQGFDPQVITALFGAGPKPGATHDLLKYGDDQLADGLRPIVDGLPGTLDRFGAYQGRRHTAGAIVVLVITAALLLAAIVGATIGGLVFGSVSILAGVVGVLIAVLGVAGPKKLSAKGRAWNDYLLGMRMYLTIAEEERLKVLQSPTGAERIDTSDGKALVKLYEQLLPWAIIWGVEDQWSKVLEIQLQRADVSPDFWVGQTAFSAAVFTPLLGGLGRSTVPVPVSTGGSNFSSFGGGSFGGGFSGGGGGGGGGGGW
jgi:uncharacterized membrane protein YgcG